MEETETQNSRRRKGKKVKKGEVKLKASCFTLSKKEAIQFMKCLLGVKFPNGYAGKISRWLDEANQHFSGMKVPRRRHADDNPGCDTMDNGQARP